ncbi:hypothetical protein DSO57_1008175 [Entomophthora muscae]|uniref:Uncharacterized protein n=1 Tax=Entomophthora muscae TaxID=34485 RepID=A0ACC2T736_9FUNG|nr:hypothetical protein DSO57_1008175 [Entomophthora muscae]
MYGFKRTSDQRKTRRSSQAYTASFHHIHFNSNCPDELHLIRRKAFKQPSKFRHFQYKPRAQDEDNPVSKVIYQYEEDDIPLLEFPPYYSWFLEYL